jgi:hypothetical protein
MADPLPPYLLGRCPQVAAAGGFEGPQTIRSIAVTPLLPAARSGAP